MSVRDPREMSTAEWMQEILDIPLQPYQREAIDALESHAGQHAINWERRSRHALQDLDAPTADPRAPDWAPRLERGKMPR